MSIRKKNAPNSMVATMRISGKIETEINDKKFVMEWSSDFQILSN